MRLSPESFPSPQASSRSAAATSVSDTFVMDTDADMQPLDLSLRSSRGQQPPKWDGMPERRPICLVKSCMCSFGMGQPHRVSPYPVKEQGMTVSLKPGMAASPPGHPDLMFRTQHQAPSPAYDSTLSSSPLSTFCYPPQAPSWTHAESTSYQLITASNIVLNGSHTPPSLFRPYHDHTGSDIKPGLHDEDQQKHSPSLPKQNDDSDVKPVYMDLDSAAPTIKYRKHSGSPAFMDKQDTIPTFSNRQRSTESKMETSGNPVHSTLFQALSHKKGCDSSDTKAAAYFVGGVISHTSLEKNQKGAQHLTSSLSSGCDSAGQKQRIQEQHQQEMYLSSVTANKSLPNDLLISPGQLSHNLSSFQSQYPRSQTVSSADEPRLSSVCLPEQRSLTSPTNQFCHGQAERQSSLVSSGKKIKPLRSPPSATVGYLQSQAAQSVSSREAAGSKHRLDGEHQNMQQSTAEPASNENSTKISLLDFMISKILMERNLETPQDKKPCDIDYICTPDGDKKIRLRLVDLMELQVEQSLKA